MPQVPVLPTTQPEAPQQPKFNLNTPLGAFGGGTAEATQGLGDVLSKDADIIFARAVALQKEQNETAAIEADTKFQIEAGTLHAQFNAREGGNAGPEAFAKFAQEINELRAQYRDTLGNSDARRQYDRQSHGTMARTIYGAASHSALQVKQARDKALDASIDLVKNSAGTITADWKSLEQDEARLKALIQKKGFERGAEAPTVAKQIRDDVSSLWANAIRTTALRDPFLAEEMFGKAEAAGKLDGPDIKALEADIRTRQNSIGAMRIEAEVNADLRKDPSGAGKTLQERLERATEIAEKQSPGNLELQSKARDVVIAKYRQATGAKKEFDETNLATVDDTWISKDIKTVDDLKKIPGMTELIERLPRKEREGLQGRMNKYWDQKIRYTSGEYLKEMLSLSKDDPIDFLSKDFLSDTKNLRKEDAIRLFNLQKQIRKNPQDLTVINHAMRVMQPDLSAAGITPGLSERRYRIYQGGMMDALSTFREIEGRRPGEKDILEIGRRLLYETFTGETGMFGGKIYERPFEMTVPKGVYESVRAEAAHKNVQLSDAEVERTYRARRFQELWGKTSREKANMRWQLK